VINWIKYWPGANSINEAGNQAQTSIFKKLYARCQIGNLKNDGHFITFRTKILRIIENLIIFTS